MSFIQVPVTCGLEGTVPSSLGTWGKSELYRTGRGSGAGGRTGREGPPCKASRSCFLGPGELTRAE